MRTRDGTGAPSESGQSNMGGTEMGALFSFVGGLLFIAFGQTSHQGIAAIGVGFSATELGYGMIAVGIIWMMGNLLESNSTDSLYR
jgi:hypothetical protein